MSNNQIQDKPKTSQLAATQHGAFSTCPKPNSKCFTLVRSRINLTIDLFELTRPYAFLSIPSHFYLVSTSSCNPCVIFEVSPYSNQCSFIYMTLLHLMWSHVPSSSIGLPLPSNGYPFLQIEVNSTCSTRPIDFSLTWFSCTHSIHYPIGFLGPLILGLMVLGGTLLVIPHLCGAHVT